MNKKQIIVIIVALTLSLLSIMLRPTIQWKNVNVHIMQTNQKVNRLYYVYIPGFSLLLGGIFVLILRNKK